MLDSIEVKSHLIGLVDSIRRPTLTRDSQLLISGRLGKRVILADELWAMWGSPENSNDLAETCSSLFEPGYASVTSSGASGKWKLRRMFDRGMDVHLVAHTSDRIARMIAGNIDRYFEKRSDIGLWVLCEMKDFRPPYGFPAENWYGRPF